MSCRTSPSSAAISASRIETRSGPFQVVALPWLTRSTFLAHDEYKNLPLDELVQQMAGLVEGSLQEICGDLDANIPTVLVGHAHVFGARVGAERLLTLGNDPILNVSVLDLPNVGYHALGHIHKHQAVVTGARAAVYAGSINRVDFSEEDERKGFVLVELQTGKSEWEFVPVKARPFLTIRSEPLTDAPTDEVVKAIYKAGPKVDGAIVRLQLAGPRSRVQADRRARGPPPACRRPLPRADPARVHRRGPRSGSPAPSFRANHPWSCSRSTSSARPASPPSAARSSSPAPRPS